MSHDSAFTKVILAFALSFMIVLQALASSATTSEQQTIRFKVMLDDKPIGFHKVRIERRDGDKTVHTEANFDVRVLFVPVYSYDHETREQWSNGCIVDLASRTDDNGDDHFVRVERQGGQVTVQTRRGSARYDDCVRSFAYWDVGLLDSGRLLNTQTGEYQAVEIVQRGSTTYQVDGVELAAQQYHLQGDGIAIDLWYTPDRRWLALESKTESGAILRYVPDNPQLLAQGTDQ